MPLGLPGPGRQIKGFHCPLSSLLISDFLLQINGLTCAHLGYIIFSLPQMRDSLPDNRKAGSSSLREKTGFTRRSEDRLTYSMCRLGYKLGNIQKVRKNAVDSLP